MITEQDIDKRMDILRKESIIIENKLEELRQFKLALNKKEYADIFLNSYISRWNIDF